MRKVDVVVLGAGPAGLAASVYLARAGVDFICIEREFQGGQVVKTYEVDNYIGFADGISGMDLAMNFYNHATRFGAEIVYDEIETYDIAGEDKVLISKNETYSCKAIIVATGARSAKLGIAGEKEFAGKGVSYCATCDGAFFKGKDVAVIGGGNTAVEDALFLAGLCNKVSIIIRRDVFRADYEIVSKLDKYENIEIVKNTVPKEFVGDANLEKIILQNKETGEEFEKEVAGAFVAVGINPNSEPFQNILDLDEYKFIKTIGKMETSLDRVYAVGDVRTTPMRQVITAAADGAIAAGEVKKALE
ncbi:thioredoxin-disulfide reductase [Treponema sp. R6D11]